MANVLQTNKRAIGIALQDDVIELSGFGKAADSAHADLEILAGHRRLGTNLPGGDFNVLFRERANHIVGGKKTASHANGVEPQAHGIFTFAEDQDIGDAGNTLQGVADIYIEVIAHEERGEAAVRRKDTGAEAKVLRGLGDCDSNLLDRVGETSLSSVDAVLDVNGGEVGIAADVEGRRNRTDAVVGAGGGYVFHALSTVDLLLEGRGYGGFDGLGTGSGIDGSNADLRGRKVRKLCYGQRRDANRARENNEQGADGGEYGAMNKKVDHKKQFSVLGSQFSDLAGCSPLVRAGFAKTLLWTFASCCFLAGLRARHRSETGCRRRLLCLLALR